MESKTFRVFFACDNDAFGPPDDDGWYMRDEIARILRDIAGCVERGDDMRWYSTIHDANGNDVGRWALKPTAEGA